MIKHTARIKECESTEVNSVMNYQNDIESKLNHQDENSQKSFEKNSENFGEIIETITRINNYLRATETIAKIQHIQFLNLLFDVKKCDLNLRSFALSKGKDTEAEVKVSSKAKIKKNNIRIKVDKLQKVKTKNTECPHDKAKHYAKNMCNNCYHSKGRIKKAWQCKHIYRFHYAHGLCQSCYQLNYFKFKKE